VDGVYCYACGLQVKETLLYHDIKVMLTVTHSSTS